MEREGGGRRLARHIFTCCSFVRSFVSPCMRPAGRRVSGWNDRPSSTVRVVVCASGKEDCIKNGFILLSHTIAYPHSTIDSKTTPQPPVNVCSPATCTFRLATPAFSFHFFSHAAERAGERPVCPSVRPSVCLSCLVLLLCLAADGWGRCTRSNSGARSLESLPKLVFALPPGPRKEKQWSAITSFKNVFFLTSHQFASLYASESYTYMPAFLDRRCKVLHSSACRHSYGCFCILRLLQYDLKL